MDIVIDEIHTTSYHIMHCTSGGEVDLENLKKAEEKFIHDTFTFPSLE